MLLQLYAAFFFLLVLMVTLMSTPGTRRFCTKEYHFNGAIQHVRCSFENHLVYPSPMNSTISHARSKCANTWNSDYRSANRIKSNNIRKFVSRTITVLRSSCAEIPLSEVLFLEISFATLKNMVSVWIWFPFQPLCNKSIEKKMHDKHIPTHSWINCGMAIFKRCTNQFNRMYNRKMVNTKSKRFASRWSWCSLKCSCALF